MSLEDDDTLMLKEDSTLQAAGIGEKEHGMVLEGCSLPLSADAGLMMFG